MHSLSAAILNVERPFNVENECPHLYLRGGYNGRFTEFPAPFVNVPFRPLAPGKSYTDLYEFHGAE